MVSTAYHPQSDGQSERINQTIEIALRFHLACSPDIPWNKFAVQLCGTLNNSGNASTGKAPNEIVYGMKLNEGLDVSDVSAKDQTDVIDERNRIRLEAADALAFAAVDAKLRYDSKHTPLTLETGDMAFVKLHQGYRFPGLENSNLSNQRAGPFKVLRKIGNLAYELEFPAIWKIHPVISIAILEPAPRESDLYQRPREFGQEPVFDNAEPEVKDRYEIEGLVDRRVRRPVGRGSKGKDDVVEYLVKWKNWGKAHNVWYDVKDLGNAKDLMGQYNAKFGLRSQREYQRVGNTDPKA